MAQQDRQYELILLGATGYTGALVAEWVTTHLPDDLKWAVAGRNAKKLQSVVDSLVKLRPDRKQPGTSQQNVHRKHVTKKEAKANSPQPLRHVSSSNRS